MTNQPKPLSKTHRKLYTHALDTELIGIREDGSTFERFEVVLVEDYEALKKELERVCKQLTATEEQAKYYVDSGIAEGERRAMQKVKEAIQEVREKCDLVISKQLLETLTNPPSYKDEKIIEEMAMGRAKFVLNSGLKLLEKKIGLGEEEKP
jgi:hypothetical protein